MHRSGTTDVSWKQPRLYQRTQLKTPLEAFGCVPWCTILQLPIASLCNSINVSSSPGHAMSQFSNHLSPSEALYLSPVYMPTSQKRLPGSCMLEEVQFSSLLEASSWAVRASVRSIYQQPGLTFPSQRISQR